MGRPYIINSRVFDVVRESIEIGWPSVYAHSDNGRRIVTPEFIERIVRAYPFAMSTMNNIPFVPSMAQSEHQRLWSSNYLSAIRDRLPEYVNRYYVSGVGYKYRDVIWRSLLIIYDRRSDREFRKLHLCMQYAENPADVRFLTNEEIEIYNARPVPADPIPSNEPPGAREVERTNVLPILVIGGITLGAVLLMGDD